MGMEKSLYAAPQGLGLDQLGAMNDTLPEVEIELEGNEEPDVGGESDADKEEDTFNQNLAENLDESFLDGLAGDLIAEYDEDVAGRKDWIQTYVDGLELLGMKIEERTEPWQGACGVYHPLLAEALVKFQAETMMSMFPAAGPVKTQIIGKETPEKKEASVRVQDDMNYQLTDVMVEYRPEHERMLWGLGLAGNAFKKVYYDPSFARQVSIFVPAEDIVVPYGASNIQTAERVTHVMRKTENELKKLQVAGFYRDVDLGEPQLIMDEVEKKIAEKMGFRASSDERFKVLEMNVYLDLEDKDKYSHKEGIALPYIVTIEKGTQKVLAVRRNWEPDDETYAKRQHYVHYGYVPGFGFYYFGLIHLVGAFAKSGTSLIRQLVDAGTLSNLPGGFKARGLRVKGDDTPIGPGEWRDVDVPNGNIRDNLLPLPYKEPSQTLAALLEKIIEEGRRFANTADLQISDMSAQAPVGTTLAIIERLLKPMSAIQARIHYSMKQELGLLKNIIRDYTPKEYSYEPEEGGRKAKQADYDLVEVIPVSDPNASTMAQKIVQWQAVMQLAQQDPTLYNKPQMHRQMLDVLGIKGAEKLVPLPEDMKPQDPVTENQNVLMMKPVKAFMYQNHQAHIMVHMGAMQDPKIMQLLQNNPQAPQLQSAMMAHINEHLGFEYRKQIEQQLGMPLPPQQDKNGEDVNMDPQVEARLAPMLAQAAQKLLAQNQQQVQQQKAQQQMQDPMMQLQMAELKIKQAEQQRKQQKDMTDAQLATKKLQMDALKSAGQMQMDKQKTMISTGVDVLKHLSDKSHDTNSQQQQRSHDLEKLNRSQQHETYKAVGGQIHEMNRHQQQHQNDLAKLQSTQQHDLTKMGNTQFFDTVRQGLSQQQDMDKTRAAQQHEMMKMGQTQQHDMTKLTQTQQYSAQQAELAAKQKQQQPQPKKPTKGK